MKLSELSIGALQPYFVWEEQVHCASIFRHGADTGNGGHCRKIRTDGRSGGIAYPQL